MSKHKKCICCGADLVCKACGESQVRKSDLKATTAYLTQDLKDEIAAKADELGISVAEYVRRVLTEAGKQEDSNHV